MHHDCFRETKVNAFWNLLVSQLKETEEISWKYYFKHCICPSRTLASTKYLCYLSVNDKHRNKGAIFTFIKHLMCCKQTRIKTFNFDLTEDLRTTNMSKNLKNNLRDFKTTSLTHWPKHVPNLFTCLLHLITHTPI